MINTFLTQLLSIKMNLYYAMEVYRRHIRVNEAKVVNESDVKPTESIFKANIHGLT